MWRRMGSDYNGMFIRRNKKQDTVRTNPLVVLASAGIFAFFMRKAGREREVVS